MLKKKHKLFFLLHPLLYNSNLCVGVRERSERRLKDTCHLRVQGSRGATLPVACRAEPLLKDQLALSLFTFTFVSIDVVPHSGHLRAKATTPNQMFHQSANERCKVHEN